MQAQKLFYQLLGVGCLWTSVTTIASTINLCDQLLSILKRKAVVEEKAFDEVGQLVNFSLPYLGQVVAAGGHSSPEQKPAPGQLVGWGSDGHDRIGLYPELHWHLVRLARANMSLPERLIGLFKFEDKKIPGEMEILAAQELIEAFTSTEQPSTFNLVRSERDLYSTERLERLSLRIQRRLHTYLPVWALMNAAVGTAFANIIKLRPHEEAEMGLTLTIFTVLTALNQPLFPVIPMAAYAVNLGVHEILNISIPARRQRVRNLREAHDRINEMQNRAWAKWLDQRELLSPPFLEAMALLNESSFPRWLAFTESGYTFDFFFTPRPRRITILVTKEPSNSTAIKKLEN